MYLVLQFILLGIIRVAPRIREILRLQTRLELVIVLLKSLQILIPRLQLIL